MTNPGYTAVTDLKTAGAIIWWRLAGDTSIANLRTQWENQNLPVDQLPEVPSPQAALTRAAGSLATKHRLVRPLPSGRGWALVDEHTTETKSLEYQEVAHLTLGPEGKVKLEQKGPGITSVDNLKLHAAFEEAQRTLTVNDVSAWLSKLVKPMLQAVSLRDTGGVYFVPADFMSTFHAMSKAIQGATTHRIFEVPALKSTDAIDAILSAVMREADTECGAMETELDVGQLKVRALGSRVTRCASLLVKVETYENLLGVGMAHVKERIESLRAGVVAAQLAIAAETDAVAA